MRRDPANRTYAPASSGPTVADACERLRTSNFRRIAAGAFAAFGLVESTDARASDLSIEELGDELIVEYAAPSCERSQSAFLQCLRRFERMHASVSYFASPRRSVLVVRVRA